MKKPKTKQVPRPRNRLSEGEMRDILSHINQRMARVVGEAIQLVEDPRQAGELVSGSVVYAFDGAIEMLLAIYEADTGKRASRKAMTHTLALACLKYAEEDA